MNKNNVFEIFYGKEKYDVWHKFLEIKSSIEDSNYLYNYFDSIRDMLTDNRSYIKLRGFIIICKLSRWDKDNKIDSILDILLSVLDDVKPTIVRQALLSLKDLFLYKPELSSKIRMKLDSIDLSIYKDSMRILINKDIIEILK